LFWGLVFCGLEFWEFGFGFWGLGFEGFGFCEFGLGGWEDGCEVDEVAGCGVWEAGEVDGGAG
jgi:hypothetical protein